MRVIKRFSSYVDSRLEASAPKPMDQSSLKTCTCKNCATEFKGNYCPCCGQSARTRRFVLKNIPEDIISAFTNIERGLPRTCLELFWRPGHMMRDYLEGKRARYTRPMQLLFITTTLYVIVHYVLFYHSGIGEEEEAAKVLSGGVWGFVMETYDFLTRDRAALSIESALMMLFPLYLTFHWTEMGKKTNLAELFFILIYVAAQSMILNILSLPYDRFVGKDTETSIGFPIVLMLIDLHQYYGTSMKKTFLRIVLSYIIVFSFIALIVLVVFLFSEATKVSADFEAMVYSLNAR